MVERFNVVGSCRDVLAQKGCPVLLSAYNILADSLTGDALLQCKFENQSKKNIKAIFIDIECFSVDNQVTGKAVNQSFLDLTAEPFSSFGQNNALKLPSADTRAVKVSLKKIVFDDNTENIYTGFYSTIFESSQEEITKLNNLESLYKVQLQNVNPETNTKNWRYLPRENDDFYQCGCCTIVSKDYDKCPNCHADLKKSIELNNVSNLTAVYNEQLEIKQKLAEENKIRADKRNKKIKKILSVIAVIAIVFSLITFVVLPSLKTGKAKSTYGTITENTKVGDYIDLGLYEQDNNSSSKEVLVWKVLAKEDNKLLLITEYVIDVKDYHSTKSLVSWENCSLRKWLNEDFKNNALTDEQKNIIIKTTLHTDCSGSDETLAQKYSSTTEDEIFILSSAELNKYFKNNKNSLAYPTEYAIGKNIKKINTCWYWCRNPEIWFSATGEFCQGDLIGPSDIGSTSAGDNKNYGVRPAMWVDISGLK